MSDVVDSVKNFAAAHGVAGELPEVRVSKVLLETAAEMGAVMARAPLFLRDGKPVVVCPEEHRFEEISTDAFITFCDAYVKVVTLKRIPGDGKDDDQWVTVRASLTKATAATILAAREFRRQLRPLRKMNLVRLPVLRDGGAVELLPVGYDEATGIFTVDTLGDYEEMGLDAAKLELMDLLGQFPFVVDDMGEGVRVARAESVQIMALLNLFCANMLPRYCSRPAYVFNANTQKSGKSLLAKMAVAAVTGTQVLTTLPQRDQGALKQILNTAALGGSPYLLFDNCEGLVEGAELAAFIQAPQWGDRRMREQVDFIAENLTTCFLTGVDFSVGPDMAQRCLFVDLFVEEGDAADRLIEREIDETWLMDTGHRRKILGALWGLVKNWAAAPVAERTSCERWLPGFRSYAEVMGGIVRAAGYADPFIRTPGAVAMDKTERDFLELLRELVLQGIEEFTFPQIMEVCRVRGLFAWFLPAYENPEENAELRLDNLGTGDDEVGQKERVKLGKVLAKRSEGSAVRAAGGESSGRVYLMDVAGQRQRVRFRACGSSAARSRRYSVTAEAAR